MDDGSCAITYVVIGTCTYSSLVSRPQLPAFQRATLKLGVAWGQGYTYSI